MRQDMRCVGCWLRHGVPYHFSWHPLNAAVGASCLSPGVMWGKSILTSLRFFWYHLVAPEKGDGGLHANMKCSSLQHLPAPCMLQMQRSAHALMALQITHPKSSVS